MLEFFVRLGLCTFSLMFVFAFGGLFEGLIYWCCDIGTRPVKSLYALFENVVVSALFGMIIGFFLGLIGLAWIRLRTHLRQKRP